MQNPLRPLSSAAAAALVLTLAACNSSDDHVGEDLHEHEGSTLEALADLSAPALIGEASIAELGEPAPNFRLLDSNGNSHDLADFRGEPVVLEWINHGCPFVVKHYSGGNMQALQEQYTAEGVTWLAICSSAPGKQGHMSADGWNSTIAEKGMNATAVLIDETGVIGKAYNARTTPNMFVIDAEGTLVYAGAIDDNSSPNSADIATSTNYVAETLDLLVSGNDVEPSATKPYGCSVKYLN